MSLERAVDEEFRKRADVITREFRTRFSEEIERWGTGPMPSGIVNRTIAGVLGKAGAVLDVYDKADASGKRTLLGRLEGAINTARGAFDAIKTELPPPLKRDIEARLMNYESQLRARRNESSYQPD
jgi:hypothetical protein